MGVWVYTHKHTHTHIHTQTYTNTCILYIYTHTHTTETLGNAGRRRAATVGAHYALDPGSHDGCLTLTGDVSGHALVARVAHLKR